MPQTSLILASASPRRRELLKQIGLEFQVHPSAVEEPAYVTGDMSTYAQELAALKSGDVAQHFPDALVIGADTIVVVDHQVLGKPMNREDAHRMLRLLSGRWHQVITAYSLDLLELKIHVSRSVSTEVHFKPLTDQEIQDYIATGSPFDKAGAYGIQDQSAIFVDQIQGCFYNVVGFPLSDFYQTLGQIKEEFQLTIQEASVSTE